MDELMATFAAQHNRFPQWAPRWNIAPTATIPIVIERVRGVREIGPASWSLIPEWSTTAELKYPTFNARSETAAEKPAFRDSLRTRRCLIPATGFFEWKDINGTKTPHFIRRTDSALCAFAGLYSWWTNPENGATRATATILTRDSAHRLREVHDRMPVFVNPERFDRWLDPSAQQAEELLISVASDALELSAGFDYFPVAPLRGDGPHLITETPRASR
jgi:putative SOS response-associated peptidase YedK